MNSIQRYSTPSLDEEEGKYDFTRIFSDEISLLLFEKLLDFKDLATASLASKGWRRLALDSQLWKRLYLRAFQLPIMKGKASAHFPSPHSVMNDRRDWKSMFQIQNNWKFGRVTIESIPLTTEENHQIQDRSPSPWRRTSNGIWKKPCSIAVSVDTATATTFADQEETLASLNPAVIAHWNDLVCVAIGDTISIYHINSHLNNCSTLLTRDLRAMCCDVDSQDGIAIITSMVFDDDQQQQDTVEKKRLLVGYNSGGFTVYELDLEIQSSSSCMRPVSSSSSSSSNMRLVCREIIHYQSHHHQLQQHRVIALALYNDIVAVCTSVFQLSIYRITATTTVDTNTTKLKRIFQMQSQVCWEPAHLSLQRIISTNSNAAASNGIVVVAEEEVEEEEEEEGGDEQENSLNTTSHHYRCTIAYSIPRIHDSGFDVGTQDINFTPLLVTSSHCHSTILSNNSSSRNALSCAPITCVYFAAPSYLLVAHEDNTVQVYHQVVVKGSLGGKLVHLTTLYGHTSAVRTMYMDVDNMKLITGAADGLRVWQSGGCGGGGGGGGGGKDQDQEGFNELSLLTVIRNQLVAAIRSSSSSSCNVLNNLKHHHHHLSRIDQVVFDHGRILLLSKYSSNNSNEKDKYYALDCISFL